MADAGTIRTQADEILARSEYAARGPSLLGRVLEPVGEAIADLLEWILRQLGGSGGGAGTGVPSILGWFVLLALIGLLVHLVTRIRVRGRAAPDPVPAARQLVREDVGRADWLARAAEAEAAGRWREAVRCRYRATVVGLVERRSLSADPGATSGEHLRRYRGSAAADPAPFDLVTERFEHVWYGGEDADSEAVAELVDADAAILRAPSRSARR